MGLPTAELTLDKFIGWENTQAERHEFHRGEVFVRERGYVLESAREGSLNFLIKE